MMSRNEPAVIERLGQELQTSLELKSSHVTRAVANFVDCSQGLGGIEVV